MILPKFSVHALTVTPHGRNQFLIVVSVGNTNRIHNFSQQLPDNTGPGGNGASGGATEWVGVALS